MKWIMQKLQWYHFFFFSYFRLADKYYDIFGPFLFAEVSRDFPNHHLHHRFRRKHFYQCLGFRFVVRESTDSSSRSRFCHRSHGVDEKYEKRKKKNEQKVFRVIFKRLLMSVLLWIASTIYSMLERLLETSCARRRPSKRLSLLPVATTKQYLKISFIR